MNDDVDEFSLDLFQKALDEFEKNEDSAIRIEISSYGGSVYDMLGMVDRIKSSPCHVITRGFGKIMSAATFILAAGDERIMGTNSWMMIHQLSSWYDGKGEEIRNEAKHVETLMKQLYDLYEQLSKGKTKAKNFAKMCEKDYYLTAQEALELGLIDKVL